MKKNKKHIIFLDWYGYQLTRELGKRLAKRRYTCTIVPNPLHLAFWKLTRVKGDLVITNAPRFLLKYLRFVTSVPVVHWDSIAPTPSWGVDDVYTKIHQQKPRYFMFLGNFLMKENGLDLLLDAYAKIAHKIRYPLLIVGNGKDENSIRRRVASLKLQKHVTFVGPTYGEKKLQLMAKALFVAFPARRAINSHFPLEAIASGLPIVAFDIPELSWSAKAYALKAVPFDTSDYARLLKFASQSKTISTMRKAARKQAVQLRWEHVIRTYATNIQQKLSAK